MRKTILTAAVAALALAACGKKEAPPAPAAAPQAAAPAEPCKLNLFIWSEYMDPDIITKFEQKYACKVTIDLYEDNESMMAKLQGGGTSQYDVVVPGNYIIPAMVKLKLLAELRHDKIPNLKNLDEKFVNPPYDPGNKYSAAYQWGTVGLFVRKKGGKPPADETWGLVFDPKKNSGPFLLIDSQREMMGSVLKYLGYSVNTGDQAQLKKMAEVLAAAKKKSQGFEGGVGGKNKVLAKAVTAAIVYNGDAVKGSKDDPDTYYFVPKEGGVIWVDNLAIPANAPHRDVAEKFIDFILDPKIGAQLSDFNQYATPNKAAKEFVNKEDFANPAIYPSQETMGKLEFVQDAGEKNQLFDEIWTQVKSK